MESEASEFESSELLATFLASSGLLLTESWRLCSKANTSKPSQSFVFFLGSNKVMQVALGRSNADEIKPQLHKVSKLLRGDTGLLQNFPLDSYKFPLILLPKKSFHIFNRYTFLEPLLRKQGMPVRLKKGVIKLVSDFVVCEEGKPVSPEASRILLV